MALTRVIQKAAEAIVHSIAKRSAMANASAGTKASIAQPVIVKLGRKMSAEHDRRPAPPRPEVSSLKVRFLAMSAWIGWTGRSSSGERVPCRIRHSNSHMIQVKVACVDQHRDQVVGGQIAPVEAVDLAPLGPGDG